jgi:hypothetical protein
MGQTTTSLIVCFACSRPAISSQSTCAPWSMICAQNLRHHQFQFLCLSFLVIVRKAQETAGRKMVHVQMPLAHTSFITSSTSFGSKPFKRSSTGWSGVSASPPLGLRQCVRVASCRHWLPTIQYEVNSAWQWPGPDCLAHTAAGCSQARPCGEGATQTCRGVSRPKTASCWPQLPRHSSWRCPRSDMGDG